MLKFSDFEECQIHLHQFCVTEEKLRQELEGMLRPAELDRADVDIIRKEVFTTNTFYVTSINQVQRENAL